MSFQIDYPETMGAAYPGMLVVKGFVASYSAETPVRYGAAVALAEATGDGERQCVMIDAANDTFLGVAIREHVRQGDLAPLATKDGDGETFYVPATDTVSVLRRGQIWVVADVDLTPSDPVFVVHEGNAGDTTPRGNFAKTIAPNGGVAVAVPNARYMTTAVAGEVILLELNLF